MIIVENVVLQEWLSPQLRFIHSTSVEYDETVVSFRVFKYLCRTFEFCFVTVSKFSTHKLEIRHRVSRIGINPR